MRTFEELKKMKLMSLQELKNRYNAQLATGGLEDSEVEALEALVKDCDTYINNINEVVTIEIGAMTNSLILAIQNAYKLQLTYYWEDFEGFMEKYVIGLTPDQKLKRGAYFGQRECYELGVGINELLCFKGYYPTIIEVADIFRQAVNKNYGTNIPMSGVEKNAQLDYERVAFKDDVVAKDEAFTHLKEVQRDSGSLMNGETYYILATDQQYQEAKSRCSGRNIKK